MKQLAILLMVLILGFTLAACGSAPDPVVSNPPTETELPSPGQPAERPLLTQPPEQPAAQDMTRSDSQGAITVEVKPVSLGDPGDTFVFEISLTTHSVDLSMDLAAFATLTTNDGRSVQATLWDAPRGGHHVSGKLSFPASIDGKELLAGATKLTLTIRDMEAPQRLFTWNLEN